MILKSCCLYSRLSYWTDDFWTCALIGWCFLCTEYTECQALYPVVRIGYSPPLAPPPLWVQGRESKLACGGGGWGDPVSTMGQTPSYSRYTIIPPHFYVSSMKNYHAKWYCFNDQIQSNYLFKTLNNLITCANSKLPARKFNDIYWSPESEI